MIVGKMYLKNKNHAIKLYTENVAQQKLNFIHRNPVVEKIYLNEQDFLFSPARNYYNLPTVPDIECLNPPVSTVSNTNFFTLYLP